MMRCPEKLIVYPLASNVIYYPYMDIECVQCNDIVYIIVMCLFPV